ncbi:MAG: signal peptidase I [Candidatus Zixiibacteriota bacterium]
MNQHKVTDSAWDNLKQVLLAVVMAVIIKTSVVEAYKIPSPSMEDTLLVGDFLLANKFLYGATLPLVDWRLPEFRRPEPGDVVIFIYPRDNVTKYIKRCVAGPGDTVEVKNKQLFVNGEKFDNPEHSKFINVYPDGRQRIVPRGPGGRESLDNYGPYVVPPESYFMMGDNRDNSSDSRVWGPVPFKNVLGKALIIHWSWDDSIYPSPDVSVSDPLSVPRMFIYNAAHFFQKVRWARLFGLIS